MSPPGRPGGELTGRRSKKSWNSYEFSKTLYKIIWKSVLNAYEKTARGKLINFEVAIIGIPGILKSEQLILPCAQFEVSMEII